MSLWDVTFFFGSSVAAEQSPFWVFRGPSRTVQSDGNAFGQNMAIRAYENRHLAQRVDLEELLIVLLVFFLGIDEVQFEAMRFRDSEDGCGSRIGLNRP